jgi:hypothetical protein
MKRKKKARGEHQRIYIRRSIKNGGLKGIEYRGTRRNIYNINCINELIKEIRSWMQNTKQMWPF